MKKGDIIYFNPNERRQDTKLEDKKHPIVCLEDVDNSMDKFHSAILSSHKEPSSSKVVNIKLNMKYFDTDIHYSIPGTYKEEYLVSMGIWKEIPLLPQQEDGKISIKGLNVILCELLKSTQDNVQNELYSALIELVRKYVKFELVTTDIRTHVNNNNLKI